MAGSGASNGGGYVVFVPRSETLDWSLLGDNQFGKVEPFGEIHQLLSRSDTEGRSTESSQCR